jgi:hypothetical protein
MGRPTCRTCPYFIAEHPTGGRCHRHAPRPWSRTVSDPTEGETIYPEWPFVAAGDSCGENPAFPAFPAYIADTLARQGAP